MVAYLAVWGFLSFLAFKKTHQKFPIRSKIFLGAIILIGFFPLMSIIDYQFQISNPLSDCLATIGFIISYPLMFAAFLLGIYFIFAAIFNKISKKHKLHLRDHMTRCVVFSLVGLFSLGIAFGGYYGAVAYEIENVNIETNINGLRIAVISDTHYATTCSTLQKEKVVEKVNALNPDVIFMVGDIFDNHIQDMDKNDFTNWMDSFKATYGCYAVLGNHELKQNSYEDAISFYSDCKNVKLLLDEEVIVGDKIRVVGRIDLQNKVRKDLKDIVSDSTLPLIVLDHQPHKFNEAKDIGAVIQFSGHTHNGQVWPYNYFVGFYHFLKHCPVDGVNKFDNFYLIFCRGTGNWGFPYKNTGSSQIVLTTGSN